MVIPITSYGIILFYVDSKDKIWFLLAQRRDTIEYTDFLRGKYTYANMETYFSLMTNEERDRIKNYSFNDLWDDLWINHNNRFYIDGKQKALSKFNTNKQLITKLLKNTRSTTTEPSWGFPKGKKHLKETEIECAFREFFEETKLYITYENLLNMSPIKEVFKGTNKKMYSTIYYIAQVNTKLSITKKCVNKLRENTVSEEIADLRWASLGLALHLLPPKRHELILECEDKIRNHLVSKV